MHILQTVAEMRAWTRAQRAQGERMVFVPTMGALHEGHASLMRLAKKHGSQVVVSIFVNPTQFDRAEDLERYPRTLDADLALCAKEGVAAIYQPDAATMYPEGFATFVNVVGPINDTCCAVARPGHFRGVCTVVTKLLNAVDPDVAIFGEKDLQQAMILSRMVRDLDMAVEFVIAPTVREVDGLAMSSRNSRLDGEARVRARSLPRGLDLAAAAFELGERSAARLSELVSCAVLEEGLELDYAEVVHPTSFVEQDQAELGSVLAVAAFCDGVRLIDHIHLGRERISVADAD